MQSINRGLFFDIYRRVFTVGMEGSAVAGLDKIMDFLQGDDNIIDVRWGAYILATIKHECANTWQPQRRTIARHRRRLN